MDLIATAVFLRVGSFYSSCLLPRQYDLRADNNDGALVNDHPGCSVEEQFGDSRRARGSSLTRHSMVFEECPT